METFNMQYDGVSVCDIDIYSDCKKYTLYCRLGEFNWNVYECRCNLAGVIVLAISYSFDETDK